LVLLKLKHLLTFMSNFPAHNFSVNKFTMYIGRYLSNVSYVSYNTCVYFFSFKKYFRANAFIYLFQQTNNSYVWSQLHTDRSIVMISLKTLHPGRIRTRVFCLCGAFDVYCARAYV
jgi:hypothetical protein